MNKKFIVSVVTPLVLLLFTFYGCDTTNTKNKVENGKVNIQLKTMSSRAKAVAGNNFTMANDSLVINGSNGTLKIDDIRFILKKFKLSQDDPGCEGEEHENENGNAPGNSDKDCKEFSTGPLFVDLPLSADTLNLTNDLIETGSYSEMEFEIGDANLHNRNEGEKNAALIDSINANYPEWPEDASFVATGTFKPEGDTARSFKIFAKLDIEVESKFEPPMEISAQNAQQVLSIGINLSRWFEEYGGKLPDLSKYDWDQTHQLPAFSLKFKQGAGLLKVDHYDHDEQEHGHEGEDHDNDEEHDD